MPVDQQLLDEIDAAIGAGVNHDLTSHSKVAVLFEAFLLGVSLEAARNVGGAVSYERASGDPATSFRFRLGPGYIYSPTDPSICHAVVSIADEEKFEIHLDVRVTGRSAVLHECDVLVLARAEGVRCRQNHLHPRASQAIATVEAKFYTDSIDLALAREFIGLTSDVLRSGCFVANTGSDQVARLLAAKSREWQDEVTPGQPGVARVKAYFEDAMRNYLARA